MYISYIYNHFIIIIQTCMCTYTEEKNESLLSCSRIMGHFYLSHCAFQSFQQWTQITLNAFDNGKRTFKVLRKLNSDTCKSMLTSRHHSLGHPGPGVWRNGVTVNVALPALNCKSVGQAQDAQLGCTVICLAKIAIYSWSWWSHDDPKRKISLSISSFQCSEDIAALTLFHTAALVKSTLWTVISLSQSRLIYLQQADIKVISQNSTTRCDCLKRVPGQSQMNLNIITYIHYLSKISINKQKLATY